MGFPGLRDNRSLPMGSKELDVSHVPSSFDPTDVRRRVRAARPAIAFAFAAVVALGAVGCDSGGGGGSSESAALDSLRHWNQVAIDASGLDHTPVQPGENRVFGEQVGP